MGEIKSEFWGKKWISRKYLNLEFWENKKEKNLSSVKSHNSDKKTSEEDKKVQIKKESEFCETKKSKLK